MDRLPPAYSETLSVGESRIEHNPSRRERRPRETWLKTEGSITIALSEQTKDIDVPRYVRRDHIHGAMLLDNREVVSSVTIKVCHTFKLYIIYLTLEASTVTWAIESCKP